MNQKRKRRFDVISFIIIILVSQYIAQGSVRATVLEQDGTKEAQSQQTEDIKPTGEDTREEENNDKEIEKQTEKKDKTTKKEKQTEEEMIQQILTTNPEDAVDPVTSLPEYEQCTYQKSFDFSEDQVFSGFFDTKNYYFKVQDYWDCEYAYAQLEFNLSQLVQGENIPASMTFTVNNIPVSSCKIDYKNGKNQIIYVNIPLDLLNEGYNSFGMSGYVRIYDEAGCIDHMSDANWVNIKNTSFIKIGYEAKDDEQRISYYPYPYMSTMDQTGEHSVVAVSDQALNGELAAALLVRADLGDETVKEDRITFARYSELSQDDQSRIVFFSTLDHLPIEYQKFLPQDLEDLTNQAVILSVRDDRKRPILLVLSKDEEALMEAAMLLLDESRVDQEDTWMTYVRKGTADVIKQAQAAEELSVQDSTLEGLTGGGLSYVGPFHQSVDIQLPNASGIVLADAGKVVLSFRYSENLDFNRSLITAYWGDIPVASKKLTLENAGGDTLTFAMPDDVIGTSATKITISFDLEIEELFCSQRADQMPWAYVTKDSSFYLPIGESEVISFDIITYPFMISNQYNHVMVVIPDNPTSIELNLLGQIAMIYGSGITSYGDLKVIRASEFTSEDSDYHIITIGNYKDNQFLAGLNENLSFQYTEDGSRFASNQQQILSDAYSSRIGILQLIESPFAKNRVILAVTGGSDEGLRNISQYVNTEKNVWKLTKDAVIIDADGETKSYTFLKRHTKDVSLSLKEFIKQNRDSVLFTLVATSAMLIMLLAVILFSSRMYIKKRERKKKHKN